MSTNTPQENSNGEPDSSDAPTLDLERIPVYFDVDQLFALSEFFNGSQEMSDFFYDPIARKVFIAAVKAGLYDDE